jgi:hypothetical protein
LRRYIQELGDRECSGILDSQSHKHVAEVLETMYRGNNLGEAVDLLMGVVGPHR